MLSTPVLALPYPQSSDAADAPAQLKLLAEAIEAALIYTGELRTFALAAPPNAHWIVSGSLVLRTDYPALFTAVGTTWNIGGELATQFRAGPLAAGRAIIGSGTGKAQDGTTNLTARALGSRAGVESVGLTSGNNGPHGHSVTDPTHAHTINSGVSSSGASGASIEAGGDVNAPLARRGDSGFYQFITENAAATGISIQNSGAGTAHENMQPSVAALICIYTGK
jgi:microcystin-dependent protein